MKLSVWLRRHDMTVNAFAVALGVHASTITRILNGRNGPSTELMIKVSQYTNGEVKRLADYEPDKSVLRPYKGERVRR